MTRLRTTLYPTLDEVLYLHNILIEKFGGRPGVRDKGLLESALARPRTGYYSSLSEQAAALLQSLMLNHAFHDGNKIVSFATAAILLRMNGCNLTVDSNSAEKYLVNQVIGKKAELSAITTWIEKHLKPVTKK